ncbi:MAG: hypothetical protein GTO67_02325 [Gammaproteobacteria bacterium]|nr:hypothetical protein [Gammaproteobacteria bacterium]NIR61467.1 hypothetical protein [Gammaproteobacteria bacterium]NIT15302.1 hypothetical protein [Gammaproteobacteria bacterium]NIV49608.1 hypothetical protein [Gammaproteobacteria bacterium]
MRMRLAALALLGIGVAVSGAAPTEELGRVAERIRDGDIDVGGTYSMSLAQGRFHRVHTSVLGVSCSTCHSGNRYPDDYFLVGKSAPRPGAPGVLDRSACLGCHRAGADGRPLYPATLGR